MQKKTIQYDATLQAFIRSTSQQYVAKRLQVVPEAIRQMLLADREIYVREINGELHYLEVKDWKQGTNLKRWGIKKKRATKKARSKVKTRARVRRKASRKAS